MAIKMNPEKITKLFDGYGITEQTKKDVQWCIDHKITDVWYCPYKRRITDIPFKEVKRIINELKEK